MRNVLRTARRRATAGAVTTLLLSVVAGGIASAPAGAAPASCQPGSGRHLAGKHVHQKVLGKPNGLQCADLRNADLTGLDLTQADLTAVLATGANFSNVHLGQAEMSGAKLAGANLSGADLTQATLTGSDFSNANLQHAQLIQADADNTIWNGADISNADMTQAELKNASFQDAKVGGADFTQADLGGNNWDGVRGLTPWSLYLLIVAGAVFVLLALLSLRKAAKRRGRHPHHDEPAAATEPSVVDGNYVGEPYQSIWNRPPASSTVQVAEPAPATGAFNPINPPASSTRGFAATLAIGLLGSLIVAFGLHLFLGGMVGSFSFAFDTLATATCSGAQCAVGVSSGTVGLIGGVFVVLAGFFIRARA